MLQWRRLLTIIASTWKYSECVSKFNVVYSVVILTNKSSIDGILEIMSYWTARAIFRRPIPYLTDIGNASCLNFEEHEHVTKNKQIGSWFPQKPFNDFGVGLRNAISTYNNLKSVSLMATQFLIKRTIEVTLFCNHPLRTVLGSDWNACLLETHRNL